jgi:hypothetical protein
MRNAGDIKSPGEVVDDVDDPVSTHPDSPFLIAAFQFFASGRPRGYSKQFKTPLRMSLAFTSASGMRFSCRRERETSTS